MVRAVKHWRHHPCKSLGGSSAYYQYHDTRILKFKQSEIIKKKFWRIRLKNFAGFPYIETPQSYLNVSEAELIHKQLLCIFFFPSSSVTPYMKYLFETDRQGIHWKSEKRLNKAFSERRQLGSTENHLFVYECCKMALCLRSLQRDIEWTLKH